MTTQAQGSIQIGSGASCDSHEEKPFVNKFSNDGSFLEMFKRMQQSKGRNNEDQFLSSPSDKLNQTSSDQQSKDDPCKLTPTETEINLQEPSNHPINATKGVPSNLPQSGKVILGKRRNQKLKVGIIKRDRRDIDGNSSSNDHLDAWTKYMKEVRQYKEKYGDDSDKKRPLVK